MRMAINRAAGAGPPPGGWPPLVLEYDTGTQLERAYRQYQCPLRISNYEAQAAFWKGRLVELWVRQTHCPWGSLEERELGRLTEHNETTIDYLNTPAGRRELSLASTCRDTGDWPPYRHSPWPFPQANSI